MPPKRKSTISRRKVQSGGKMLAHYQPSNPYQNVQSGDGFFDGVWDSVKSLGNFVKDNKLLSTGLSLIPDGRAKIAGGIASQLGLGKRRGRKNVLKF